MELELCSLKVRERAAGPKFLGNELECEEFMQRKDHFFCHFHFPNSNGEITVYGQLTTEGETQAIKEAKYFTNVEGAPLAFLDALIELAHKRDSQSLPLLRMKEIDAFLRSKNTEPSFPDDGIKLLRYYEIINALQYSISKKNGLSAEPEAADEKKSPTLEEYRPHSRFIFDRVQMGEFSDLDNELKILFVGDVLNCHVRPLLQRDGGDVECIYVMENLVVINYLGSCGACEMSHTTTMDFIKKVLRTELFDMSIDIITDS